MLFNLCAWPACDDVKPIDEASWIGSCRVQRVEAVEAVPSAWGEVLREEGTHPPVGYRRLCALTLSQMRKLLTTGFPCPVPGEPDRDVKPAAFVFIGGGIELFRGVMPGVLQEFLLAAQLKERVPIYLMGGLGGATREIARALLAPEGAPCPPVLTLDHYRNEKTAGAAEYKALLGELKPPEKRAVEKNFTKLWRIIDSHRGPGGLCRLLDNGLDEEKNRELLTTANTIEAVRLIWEGMTAKFLAEGKAPSTPQAGSAKKPARRRKARGR
jgi:hypothetical protein